MKLQEYFAAARGTSILSSADQEGRVTSAVYSAPRVREDGTVVFIMRERLTYRNVRENPHAALLFIEDGPGHRGVRLFLTRTGESDDPGLIASMTRRHLSAEEDRAKGPKHLVSFRVDRILPLVGDGETGLAP